MEDNQKNPQNSPLYREWCENNPRLAWALENYPEVRFQTLLVSKITSGNELSSGEKTTLRLITEYMEAQSRVKKRTGSDPSPPSEGVQIEGEPILICHHLERSEPRQLEVLFFSLNGWRGGFETREEKDIEFFNKMNPTHMRINATVSHVVEDYAELRGVSYERGTS